LPVMARRARMYGPGASLEMSAIEAARLRALGFLHDPARYLSDAEVAALPPPQVQS
jgi:hypothetical protein